MILKAEFTPALSMKEYQELAEFVEAYIPACEVSVHETYEAWLSEIRIKCVDISCEDMDYVSTWCELNDIEVRFRDTP